jgi:hypothetical protein
MVRTVDLGCTKDGVSGYKTLHSEVRTQNMKGMIYLPRLYSN